MKKTFTILIFIAISLVQCVAQQDSVSSRPIKSPSIVIAEIVGSNIVVNRINGWVFRAPWANVTFDNIRSNFNTGFTSDGDQYGVNFLGHPYQGSFYYNASRSRGYNMWQSIPGVVFGSWSWEYFGENEPPSEIDINTTPWAVYI